MTNAVFVPKHSHWNSKPSSQMLALQSFFCREDKLMKSGHTAHDMSQRHCQYERSASMLRSKLIANCLPTKDDTENMTQRSWCISWGTPNALEPTICRWWGGGQLNGVHCTKSIAFLLFPFDCEYHYGRQFFSKNSKVIRFYHKH